MAVVAVAVAVAAVLRLEVPSEVLLQSLSSTDVAAYVVSVFFDHLPDF